MARSGLKSPEEIQAMREAGVVAARVLRESAVLVVPGARTIEIDQEVGRLITRYGGVSAFYRYRDFPGQCCLSVNEAIIHGIGNQRVLRFGDLVKLDVGVRLNGFIGDVAMTVACGGCSPKAQKLMDVTIAALYRGINAARAGNSLNDIGRAVQSLVEGNGFGVVREFCGHGVGRSVHEEPQVPNYVDRDRGHKKLKAGMTIAIEPMVTEGSPAIELLDDKWTVVTRDGKLSAHFEHTVLVTEGEPEILTRDSLPPLY